MRRLGSLATEKRLRTAMETAEQQYLEVLRLHALYCAKKGEDQTGGAHIEWENGVGDDFNEAYTAAEEKLEALEEAKQPPEQTLKAKLARAKMELGVMEVEINLDVASFTESLKAATLSSKELEGLLAEKVKVEARMEEYCVNADQLVDLALAS